MRSIDETAERFRRFAGTEAAPLPVYARLVTAAADDEGLMALMEAAPRGQRRPNLLLAAVHDLLLAGVDHPLAAWYPSVTGHPPPPGDPFPAFADLVATHREAVTATLAHRSTQTNEPNRSCLWRVAVPQVAASVDEPVALLEVGASMGLNLCFDRYPYAFDPGPAEAAALLHCRLRRPVTIGPVPPIVARAGLDLEPVDVADETGVRWVKACIWPEQPERHARFDAAVAAVASDPPPIHRGDLVDDLASVVATLPPDAHLVVVNSWVLFYVERSRRREFEAALAAIAGDGRTVTWLSAEGPGVVAWAGEPDDFLTEPHSVVARTTWGPGWQRREVLARCHAHLEWLEWLAEPPV